jgi:BirA family biotin operon repressor/biotin-[acetyl-CoA-carboxylase] ligase
MDKIKCLSAFNFIKLEQVASTNKYALDWLARGQAEENTVIYTDCQTHGRGQGNNHWESAPSMNITASAILSPRFLDPSKQFFLSIVVSLSIAQTIQALVPHETIRIKWPNDIYAGDRKIAGILIHHSLIGTTLEHSVCGMGVNINQTVFSPQLPNPVSLKMLKDDQYDSETILHSIIALLDHYYCELQRQRYHELSAGYQALLYRRHQDRQFLYRSETIRASIQGVDNYGRLILQSNGKQLVCDMKEIGFII